METSYPKNIWEEQHLAKKLPKPITNAFAYNPQQVLKPVNFQTGIEKNPLKDSRKKALLPGKRLSKSGKIYYENRANHSDLDGRRK